MKARSELCWTEAYGLMQAGPGAVHGSDWDKACTAVESQLGRMLPQSRLEAMDAAASQFQDRAPAEILHRGAGWGALELQRRARAGEPPFCKSGLIFDEHSLSEEQRPWLTLLNDGRMPERDPSEQPNAWMIQDEWRHILRSSVDGGRGEHWLAWLHLGVMQFALKRFDEAKRAWEKSFSLKPSAWALRNLSVCEAYDENFDTAADLLLRAREMLPDLVPLTVECLLALLNANRAEELMRLLRQLPVELQNGGRVRILEARAAADLGDLLRAESILMDDRLEVADLREGEQLLSELWYAIHLKKVSAEQKVPVDRKLEVWVRRHCPPPMRIDFRQAYSEDY
jgi:tetratricopeptide (TPR) repeat protein